MPIPEGLDVGYVWCLLWIVLGLGLLTAFHQLTGVDALEKRVRARTFRRLLPLNEYLSATIGEQWKKRPPEDVIPDHEALLDLQRRVDIAAIAERRLIARIDAAELGRGTAGLHIVGALMSAGALLIGLGREAIRDVATVTFVVLVGVCMALLVRVLWLNAQISGGNDF